MFRSFAESIRLPHLLAAGLLAAGALLAAFPPAGMFAGDAQVAALVAACIILWATGLLPESLTALIFFTAAMLTRAAPPEVVFAGLASSAFWLILSGLVIGAAVKQTGLGDRIADRLAAALGNGRRGALAGVVLFGLAMAFLMPSAMGRVVLMMPILAALAERLGHVRHSRGYHGLVLGGVFGTLLPSFAILPSNVPNNILGGLVEAIFGTPLTFGDYFLIHFPVLGALKTIMLAIILWALYHHETAEVTDAPRVSGRPMSQPERRLAVILGCALALWATDPLHHISPAWVGMIAAIACLTPSLGVLPPRALQTISLEPLFYVAAIISLGAVITHAGLGQRLAAWVLDVTALVPGSAAANFAQLCSLSSVVGLLTTLPGVPAILTPLSGDLAAAAGLPVPTILATQVIGFSTAILPYQVPALVMAMQLGDLPRREVTRLCLVTAGATVLVLWPLDFLWLTILGHF